MLFNVTEIYGVPPKVWWCTVSAVDMLLRFQWDKAGHSAVTQYILKRGWLGPVPCQSSGDKTGVGWVQYTPNMGPNMTPNIAIERFLMHVVPFLDAMEFAKDYSQHLITIHGFGSAVQTWQRKVERTNHSHHKDARKNATVKKHLPHYRTFFCGDSASFETFIEFHHILGVSSGQTAHCMPWSLQHLVTTSTSQEQDNLVMEMLTWKIWSRLHL